MPKRKSEDKYEKLLKKFKKLEKKVLRECHSRSRSKSPDNRSSSESQEQEHNNVIDLLDGVAASEASANVGRDTEFAAECEAEVEPGPSALLPADGGAGACAPAAPTTPTAPTALSTEDDLESTNAILDDTILEILGDDPTVSNTYGAEIHKDLAVRLEHISTHGITKELRKELNEKYALPSNCKLINAPVLNAEIKAATSDANSKRDKNIEIRQKQTATAISCLSRAINTIITKSDADPELVKLIMDAERILCDSQYQDSIIRRNFILSSLKKEMREQLQNTKPDQFLFGENLSDTIKTAKAISKSGAELKTPLPRPHPSKKMPAATPSTSRNNLNWKGPYPPRKQPIHPKTKEPPPNRTRPSNSSRPSQHQSTRGRR